MTLNNGWLNRQFETVSKDVNTWPQWMKREAGFVEQPKAAQASQPQRHPPNLMYQSLTPMPNSSTSALCSVPCVTGDGHTATLTLSPTRRPSADFKLQIFRDRDHVSHTLYLTDRQAWEFFRAALCAVAQTGPTS